MEKEPLTEQDIVCQNILKAGIPIDPCRKCTPEKKGNLYRLSRER